MRLIIAGSRRLTDPRHVREALVAVACKWWADGAIVEVVSGGAAGVDRLGERWALDNQINLTRFLPDWTAHGKQAGPIRNEAMAAYADALLAVWDGESRGTAHMIYVMRRLGKPVYVHQPAFSFPPSTSPISREGKSPAPGRA